MNNLYDRDFNLWVESIKTSIKNKQIHNIDWENLMDEIDDMGKSEKRSLESYLKRLIEHILKLKYWQNELERNQKHWQVEVVNFRRELKRLLKRSPSLKRYLEEVYPEIYDDAIAAWSIQFPIPDNSFVKPETIMQDDYFG